SAGSSLGRRSPAPTRRSTSTSTRRRSDDGDRAHREEGAGGGPEVAVRHDRHCGDAAHRWAALLRVRADWGGEAVFGPGPRFLLLRERHDRGRGGASVDATVRRGAPDGHAGAALDLTAA